MPRERLADLLAVISIPAAPLLIQCESYATRWSLSPAARHAREHVFQGDPRLMARPSGMDPGCSPAAAICGRV